MFHSNTYIISIIFFVSIINNRVACSHNFMSVIHNKRSNNVLYSSPYASSSSTSPISMGTTIIALRCKTGVVVGADSRTSVSGYCSNRFASKITFLLDPHHSQQQSDNRNNDDSDSCSLLLHHHPYQLNHYSTTIKQNSTSSSADAMSTCCICRSGSAADTQHICKKVFEEFQGRSLLLSNMKYTPTVTNVAHLAQRYIYENSGRDLTCSLICAGYDHMLEKGVIYSITQSGFLMDLTNDKVAVSGSGSTYVMGFLENAIEDVSASLGNKEELMDEEKAIELVTRAIYLAISKDGSSGGDIRVYTIGKHGKRDVSPRVNTSSKMKENETTKKTNYTSKREVDSKSKAFGVVNLNGFADPMHV